MSLYYRAFSTKDYFFRLQIWNYTIIHHQTTKTAISLTFRFFYLRVSLFDIFERKTRSKKEKSFSEYPFSKYTDDTWTGFLSSQIYSNIFPGMISGCHMVQIISVHINQLISFKPIWSRTFHDSFKNFSKSVYARLIGQ